MKVAEHVSQPRAYVLGMRILLGVLSLALLGASLAATAYLRGPAASGFHPHTIELVLSALPFIPEGRVIFAAASDGWDNTDVAGAVIDATDRDRAEELKLDTEDFLVRSDSYHFWRAMDGGILTGRTGVNIADFYLVLSE